MYLNLHKEIYYPDHQQIQVELRDRIDEKSDGGSSIMSESFSSDDESSRRQKKKKKKIKSVGIEEEDTDLEE